MKYRTLTQIVFLSMIAMVLSAGIFFRFWKLGEIPPGVHYDEAYNAVDAIKTLENGEYKIFYPENNGREGLWMAMIAISFKFFGINIFAFRAVAATVGAATLIGFFLLLRRLGLAKLSVFLGLSAMCFSFWHLNFSRIMYRGILLPLLLVWIFYFFFQGLHSKKYGWIWMSAAGILTGLGFHTYISFRVMPLIFIIIALAYLFFRKKEFIKKHWKNALVLFVSAVIVAAPIFFYFFNHRDEFVGRSNSVSILSSQELSIGQAFGKSLAYHLGAFLVYGDPNQRHNNNALPLIPAVWGVLFVIGFVLSIKEIFQTLQRKNQSELFEASILAQGIFWTMLIPGVMSIEGIPHALRIIGVIPAIFIFIAIPFDYLLRLYRKIGFSKNVKKKMWRYTVTGISIMVISLIVLINGAVQVVSYFYEWSKNPKTIESFDRQAYDFGKLVSEMKTADENILVIPQHKNIFSEGKESDLKPTEFTGHPNIKSFVYQYPLDALQKGSCENAIYLFFEADSELIKQFERKCPEMQAEKIKPEKGLYEFWVMK